MKNVWGDYRNNWHILVTCLLSSIITFTLSCLVIGHMKWSTHPSVSVTLYCALASGCSRLLLWCPLEIQTLCSLCSDFPGAPAYLSAPSWSLSPDGTGAAKWQWLKASAGWRVLRLIHHQLPVCACVHWNWVWTCHWIKQNYYGTMFFCLLVGFGFGEKIPIINAKILSGLTWRLVLSPQLLMILLLLLFWQQLGGSRRMLKLWTKHKIVVRRWALGSYILGSDPSSGISGCVALSKSLHLSELSSLTCHNQKRMPSYLARLS